MKITERSNSDTLIEKKYFIVDKAVKLFYNVGIQSVSMDDIATECGMSKKTIYGNFKNKAELIKMAAQITQEEFELSLKNINSTACNPIDELTLLFKYIHHFLRGVSRATINDLKKQHIEVYKKHIDLGKSLFSTFLKRNISYGIEHEWYVSIENIDRMISTYIEFIAFILLEKTPLLINENETLQFEKLMINLLAVNNGKIGAQH